MMLLRMRAAEFAGAHWGRVQTQVHVKLVCVFCDCVRCGAYPNYPITLGAGNSSGLQWM